MDEAKSCENCNHAELMDATCHACKRNPDIDDDVTPFSAFNRNELGDNWEKRKMDDAKSCEIIMEVKKTPLILYKNKWKEEWSKTSKEGKGIVIGIIIILTNTLLGFILLQLNFNNNNNIIIIVSLIGLDFYGIGFILLGFYKTSKIDEIIMEVKKTLLILYKNKWKEEWSKTPKEGKGIFIGIIIILTNTLLGFILLQLNFNNNNNILIIVSLIGLDFYGIGFILLGFYGFKYVKLKIFKILLFSLFIFGILNLCYWNIFIWIF